MTEGEPRGCKQRGEMVCQSLNLKPPTAGWQPEGNLDPLLLHIQLSDSIFLVHPGVFHLKGQFCLLK